MRIPPPPQSSLGSSFGMEPIEELLRWVNNCFRDIDFDDRYLPRFEWFRQEIPQPETILNVGCGGGRETFALMWTFGAIEAIGIDIDNEPKRPHKIFIANRIAQTIREFPNRFSTEVMPLVSKGESREYIERLQAWYETSVPSEIKKGIVPKFFKEDISESISQPLDYFDLVYSRYVLDKVMDESEDGLKRAIQNIVRAVKLKTGRIIFVVPTEKDKNGVRIYYDFEQHFPKDLSLLVVKDGICLGDEEWPETNPKGYICTRL
jgi:SAM-dependent methyltransferase